MFRKVFMIPFIFFLLGVGSITALVYPFASNYFKNLEYAGIEQEYVNSYSSLDPELREEMFEKAREFGRAKGQGYSWGDYYSLLNLSGDPNNSGTMAILKIPAIGANLPVYHGSHSKVLDMGVGHLEDTDLPVGGESTHSVLTGHSGMPNQRMFDNIGELKEGDLINVNVLGEDLYYRVFDQVTVLPKDVHDHIQVQEGKDLLSLFTCTPYGINTHRLIVTAERTDAPGIDPTLGKSNLDFMELVKWAVPYLIGVFIISFITFRMIKKNRIQYENWMRRQFEKELLAQQSTATA